MKAQANRSSLFSFGSLTYPMTPCEGRCLRTSSYRASYKVIRSATGRSLLRSNEFHSARKKGRKK